MRRRRKSMFLGNRRSTTLYSGKNRFKNSRGRNAKGIARSKRHRLHAFYK